MQVQDNRHWYTYEEENSLRLRLLYVECGQNVDVKIFPLRLHDRAAYIVVLDVDLEFKNSHLDQCLVQDSLNRNFY
jgi:hypothetical protein